MGEPPFTPSGGGVMKGFKEVLTIRRILCNSKVGANGGSPVKICGLVYSIIANIGSPVT